MSGYVESRIVPAARKIAILRANGIGDFMFSLPALDALRATYPKAEIVLLGLPWHRDFLDSRPGPIDRVVVVPPFPGVSGPEGAKPAPEVSRFLNAMRDERFDIALQMQGGGRNSNPLVRRLGARLTAGLRAEDAPPLDRWVRYVYFQNEIERYLEVASLVGAVSTRAEPAVTLTEADRQEAERLRLDWARVVVLHVGAGDSQRRWPPSSFVEVGRDLARRGLRIVVTGSSAEADLVREVADGVGADAMDLAGRLSLGGLAAVLFSSRLVVANDSGPLHLAHAVGGRTVGLFTCCNIITAGIPSRLRHRPLISWRRTCPKCGIDRTSGECEHRESFVAEIDVASALAAVNDLLDDASATIGPDRSAVPAPRRSKLVA